MTDRLFQMPCVECEQPMTRTQGPGLSFAGDDSVTNFTFECQASGCQCTARVEYRTFIPVDIAMGREGRP